MVLVYSYVAALENTGNLVTPTVETLCKVARLSDRRTRELISKMRDIGMLEVTQRKHRPSILNTAPLEVVETSTNIEGEDQNVAIRPTPSRKPKLTVMENKEQHDDDSFNNGGDDVQHYDPVPINTDVIDSIQPKEVGAANDPVLPVNGSDNDRSDEVITADVKDDLEMYTQIADNWGLNTTYLRLCTCVGMTAQRPLSDLRGNRCIPFQRQTKRTAARTDRFRG